jgi:hypothetical protein
MSNAVTLLNEYEQIWYALSASGGSAIRTGSTNGGESMQHRPPVSFMPPLQIRHPILLMSGRRPIDSPARITPHMGVTVPPDRKIWRLRGKPVYRALREIPALPPQL